MSNCPHDFTEREIAVSDGYCPLCMSAEIERLRAGRDELLTMLKFASSIIGHPDDSGSKLIHAAIIKAEGEK